MTPLRPARTPTRAPRAALRGSVSAVIQLENRRQFSAKLHQLSITGGLLEVAAYIDERSKVRLAFPLGSGLLQATAEMLFPMRGGLGFFQPFRFTAFAAGTLQTLERELAALLQQTLPPAKLTTPVRSGHGTGLRLPRFFLDSF